MMKRSRALVASAVLFVAPQVLAGEADIKAAADAAARTIMQQHDVPGLAIAVTQNGERHLFNYGVAARDTGLPVTDDTIFEIGSVSKTFTAALGGVAMHKGLMKAEDPAGGFLPWLGDGALARTPVMNLATYTAGGLPLQFPDNVTDDASMQAWFAGWKPKSAPGQSRQYSNPSIGLYGAAVAAAMDGDFAALMQREVIQPLGLQSTFTHVPDERMDDYAWGLNRDGRQVRVNPGALDTQAYGIKTTASDLALFLEAQMEPGSLEGGLAQAHRPQFQVGPMLQAYGWEIYEDPADLDALLAGNSTDMAMKAQEARPLETEPALPHALYNKTGSTAGFGAYAAFLPDRQAGIAILANRNYPNADRIRAAHAILQAMDAID
ncbi:beta-lactamase [Aureimonas altamirensis]|uniref:class C beta-lactamase n=1 Tax=Aureimonas altamirensis TaxID=370622 RepID=UPI001E2FE4B7|nr:class C beta-lactamase [Aureimonas altamirensis]UHD43724.1 beta-lactamase [Aureimonas altamirensis]